MGIKITDMDTFGSVNKNDLVEVARPGANGTANSTGSASMQVLGAYFKNLNNGGFRGEMTKDLTDVTFADTGTWWWHGTPALTGMPDNGILEVICSVAPEDVTGPEAPTITLRLMNGDSMFVKSKPGNVTGSNDSTSIYPWGVCKNKNGNRIYSGYTSDAQVNFPTGFFTQKPAVVVTPVNQTGDAVYLINLATVESTGFSVIRYALSKAATKTVTSEVVEEEGENPPTKTTTTTMEYNQWVDGTFGYHYIATQDG